MPLFFDEYRRNRATGSFILIDEATNNTVGAGMILGATPVADDRLSTTSPGTRAVARERPGDAGRDRVVHRAVGLGQVDRRRARSSGGSWRTAAPPTCSTATTCATASMPTSGSRPADRTENIRRVGEVARLFADAGVVAFVPVISPYRADRAQARGIHDAVGLPFVEVYVDTPIEVCEASGPEGPLRQGAGRGDHRVHGHRRPVRAARVTGSRIDARRR